MFSLSADDGTAITVSGQVPADPQAVFDAFTVADRLESWWPTEASTDPRPGGSYHLAWPGPDWHLRGEYLEVQPPSLVRFGWKWDHEDAAAEVTVRLRPEDDGTLVDVIHTYSTSDERDGYLAGWLHFLPKLAEVLRT